MENKKQNMLLVTPPFLQLNAPYPATPHLSGYLRRKGFDVDQFDLSIELICEIFSRQFLSTLFERYATNYSLNNSDNISRIYALRNSYIETVESVIKFLQGHDPSLATLICMPDYLPQAASFESVSDLSHYFGSMGQQDCATYIATLYLQDIGDFIRATVSENFELVRYGERLSMSLPEFVVMEEELGKEYNLVEQTMVNLLDLRLKSRHFDCVGFTIPFPGNLLSSLKCAQYIRSKYPDLKIVAGGGYPSTELRDMSDKAIFNYFDYIVLDDGELALERILTDGTLTNTLTIDGYHSDNVRINHSDRGCPDYTSLPHDKYMSLCEVTNPMHRLWSNGRWNKMALAHGCYWAKCAFCDTSLDYINCYSALNASTIVDYMEQIAETTGSLGFHFVDEAAPPKLLKEMSLELLRRGKKFSWWTNIRFEASFTEDLAILMAAAGCIAVSGGLETASDSLLQAINKGVTIEQATIALRNFYYAGIMTHTYLMYGIPRQTYQETVDSLEVIRQLFRAQLIDSAFWHRYAMTTHSPMGADPEKYGIRRKKTANNPFANNEIGFSEQHDYEINIIGESLCNSLAHYMLGEQLERPAYKWFTGKAPQTTIEPTLVTDHLIRPDSSRIYNENSRFIWIGGDVTQTDEGLLVHSNRERKVIKFSPEECAFILKIILLCCDFGDKILLDDVSKMYAESFEDSFLVFYHSKKWGKLRKLGLLQI